MAVGGGLNSVEVLLLDAEAARDVRPRRDAAGRARVEKRAADVVGSALEMGRVQRGIERARNTILNFGSSLTKNSELEGV